MHRISKMPDIIPEQRDRETNMGSCPLSRHSCPNSRNSSRYTHKRSFVNKDLESGKLSEWTSGEGKEIWLCARGGVGGYEHKLQLA